MATASALLLLGGLYLYGNRQQIERNKGLGPTINDVDCEKEKREYMVNNRAFLFDVATVRDKLMEVGAQPYGLLGRSPVGIRQPFFESPPVGADRVEWTDPHAQFMRTPEFRKLYADNYADAYSTELQMAVDTGLVADFWHETITKGDVLRRVSFIGGNSGPRPSSDMTEEEMPHNTLDLQPWLQY